MMVLLQNKRCRFAFTLIELLVVISIIALMLSILMPALSKVRKSARSILCSANLRQCGVAMVMYADDYEGKSPPDPLEPGEYWFHKLAPYLGDENMERETKNKSISDLRESPELLEVVYCPVAKKTKENYDNRATLMKWGAAELAWSLYGTDGSYGRNGWVYPEPNPDFKSRYYPVIQFAKSDVPVFADSVWVNAWPDDIDEPPADLYLGSRSGDASYGMGRFCIDRHSMKINVSFVDGHTESVQLKDLWKLSWHKEFKPKEMNDIKHYRGG